MVKKKKTKYWVYICPECNWHTVGNWKAKQLVEYYQHFGVYHTPKPYIKTEMR